MYRLLWEACVGSHHRATQIWPIFNPLRPTIPPNLRLTTPVKTCIANCGQTVPDTTVVCTYSLWEHAVALSNSTIVDP